MSEYRTFDGSANNQSNPLQGSANTRLKRMTEVAYADGVSAPAVRGSSNPNPRVISNKICKENKASLNQNGLTDFVWAWGQFLDHEIDLTEGAEPTEELNIEVDKGDPKLPKGGVIPFKRSVYDVATGTDNSNPRQQINQISAYVDASNVYGSDDERASFLRKNDGSGKLKTSESANGDMLPFNDGNFANAPDNSSRFFIAGDIRANENAILTSIHTLFVREHNRLCDDLVTRYPDLSGNDEAVYQLARAMVIGQEQVITYQELLPALLGDNALPAYTGYNNLVDASIDNVFSTACYRLGHSMLSNEIKYSGNGVTRPLKDLFFTPELLIDDGIDPFLAGLHRQTMREIDVEIVDGVRDFLFMAPENGTMLDLAALNVQRGRDHGLPGLNACREAFGLSPHADFSSLTSDKKLQKQLELVYADVNEIDPWVGGLAEDHVANSNVGEFIQAVLASQFTRLRDGDRFWHEIDPAFADKPELLDEVKNTRLSDVIKRNTGLNDIPDNLFTS